ncbi:NYN domain-containing protein [Luteolibacter ambystomatis]|uniref:NYN domain-containing protein n=1 Tax=Luteolibacter ambystomatis TaxID=2824561 RepID=A0A975G691_9BACT|nr:NYN domain-containing protein [Luteolibacter ambystomatis]QUE49728.1 NYN domain-containing protein [Luteolibacter ambystomatis]
MPSVPSSSLAILIDADNASPTVIAALLAEAAKYGTASVKRIYGDWTHDRLGGWKKELLHHSIQPIQQFAYTTGKNATDSAMIIDAMDLLYTNRFQGFCLVSSDSDFTRLATRIREQGLTVYGFGEKKTPAPFVSACDKFIHTELLEVPGEEKDTKPDKPTAKDLRKNTKLINLIDQAIKAGTPEESDWANLGAVGSLINKQHPAFDSRSYGYPKLRSLIEATGLYEFNPSEKHLQVRRRPKA